MNGKRVVFAAVTCASLAGCAATPQAPTPVAEAGTPPLASGRSVAVIPWQLTPASTASRAQGEVTEVRDVPGFGNVRGTTAALADLDKKMVPYPVTNKKPVLACEKELKPQAVKEGAYSVEAAAAGPVKVSGDRQQQQVLFRILYKTGDGIEIRQHSVNCTVSARGGKLLDAKPV